MTKCNMSLHKHVYLLTSFFPEIVSWKLEKVKTCLIELFSYKETDLSTLEFILHDIQHVKTLIELPKVPQRSKEWFDLRENRLTASDLAQALGRGKFGTRKTLLQKKAFPNQTPFKTMAALKWGTMFEEMGMRCYQQNINPSNIYEFGLIPHKTIDCFGASPDGITETGLMIEMKCPFIRKCDDTIPEQYYIQIQGQLATCELHFCDYVECYYDAFNDLNEYKIICHDLTTKNHGIILEFMVDQDYKYVYSPENYTVEQCIEWANTHVEKVSQENPSYRFSKMTPWKLKKIFHKQVTFDPVFWESTIPEIYTFWKEVDALRKEGLKEPIILEESSFKKGVTLDLVTPPKYKFIEDSDDEQ